MASLISLSITFPQGAKDLGASALLDFGISGFVEGTGEIEPSVATESDNLTCYLDNDEIASRLITFVSDQLNIQPNDLTIVSKIIENEDWQTAWQKYWKPIHVGRSFCICPSWENYEPKPHEHVIKINPHMAFGTGTHETTQMCLELIEQIATSHNADSFIDIGCGTGILSVAASQLGVPKIRGIDIDQSIIDVANENAALNNIANLDFSTDTLDTIEDSYDIVCANILSSILQTLWPQILRLAKPHSKIILSGILKDELDTFCRSLNIHQKVTIEKGEWVAIMLDR